MGPIAVLAHLIDFAAPAVGLALGLTLSAHLGLKKVAAAPAFKVQFVINASVGLAVLLAGLLLFGRDDLWFRNLPQRSTPINATSVSRWLQVISSRQSNPLSSSGSKETSGT
ncbi:MAG: hypothetical protein EBY25_04220 [Betaproteobacteria bacterium]|nr:hypothetical protein [Betaproteobacteria bacterium]